ncbi:MAG: CPBP family intramembrane metalloprotease [Planctomycetes bacterium]|nr:CPBP family intramembrane metalloprotease [Planctomycetota bacterium]
MDRKMVGIVYRRELRDTLRDRRTLFLMLGLPLVLYPLLLIGTSQLVVLQYGRVVDQPPRVAVLDAPPDFGPFLDKVSGEGLAVEVRDTKDPLGALEAGEIEAWVDFDGAVEGTPPRAKVRFDGTNDRSTAARTRLVTLLRRYREKRVEENLEASGLDRTAVTPFDIAPVNVAGASARGGALFGKVLAILLVLMAVTFPFYPAIDAAAGEKERGTLETLLVTPVGRTELVMGKYLSILTVALVGSTLNLVAMAFTFSHFASLVNEANAQARELRGVQGDPDEVSIEGMVEKKEAVQFRVDGATILALLIVLVPLCALFSALALALSAFARTYKEGQYYLTPLIAAVLPLALVPVLPEFPLTWTLSIVPVANVCLLFREVLSSNWLPGHFVVVQLSTFAYAALALVWAQRLFRREEVLFRQPGTLAWRFWRASPDYGKLPRARHAFFLFVLVLLLMWFAGQEFQRANLVRGLVLSLLFLVLSPALATAALYRFDWKATFAFRVPSLRALAGAVVLGLGAFLLARQVLYWQSLAYPLPEGPAAAEELARLPLAWLVLIACVLAPLCEEALCRGFLLRGFSAGRGIWAGVVFSAACFALLHLSPHRFLFTFTLGLALGFAVHRSGSLATGILLHGISNGTALVVATNWPDLAEPRSSLPWWLLAAGLALAAAGVLLLALRGRARKQEEPAETGGVPNPDLSPRQEPQRFGSQDSGSRGSAGSK